MKEPNLSELEIRVEQIREELGYYHVKTLRALTKLHNFLNSYKLLYSPLKDKKVKNAKDVF